MPLDPTVVPETLEQCFEQLQAMMEEDPEGGERFLETDERGKDVTYMYHHTLGRWIRNNWGLNHSHGKLHAWLTKLGLHHPDDMSGLILTSFWRHKNGKDLDIDGQVQYFKNYWERMEKQPPAPVVTFGRRTDDEDTASD